jgi:2,4-dienoyl-CoA reductase-like NADH-dependent reductase (Old Yellow Enzyme family)
MRLVLEIAKITRDIWPKDKPVFVRISATDWDERGEKDENGEWISWGIEQSKMLASELHKLGVDLLDVSSGGNWCVLVFVATLGTPTRCLLDLVSPLIGRTRP